MFRRALNRLATEQSGVAMVEFALVLPVLLLVVFGIFEFGRAFNYWNDTNQLAADAARFAAVGRNPGPQSTLAAFIQQQGTTAELRNGTGQVTAPVKVCFNYPQGQEVGKPVVVTVTADYRFLDLNGVALFNKNLNLGTAHLKGEATMRVEQLTDDSPANGSCS